MPFWGRDELLRYPVLSFPFTIIKKIIYCILSIIFIKSLHNGMDELCAILLNIKILNRLPPASQRKVTASLCSRRINS